MNQKNTNPWSRTLRLALVLGLSAALAACNRAEPPKADAAAPADPYDITKMDFKPGKASISNERHTGPFASGSALSLDAAVKPLAPENVKEVRLDTTHKVIEIAPGVKFSAWTFGDQVPGPVVRMRVGDRIKFSMTNRSDALVSG